MQLHILTAWSQEKLALQVDQAAPHWAAVKLKSASGQELLLTEALPCGECSACPLCAHAWLTLSSFFYCCELRKKHAFLLQVEYPKICGLKHLDSELKINLDHLHIYNLGLKTQNQIQNLSVLCTPTPLSPESRITYAKKACPHILTSVLHPQPPNHFSFT